jgi:hypothetical protein
MASNEWMEANNKPEGSGRGKLKVSVRIFGVPAEIRTGYLPNKN